MKKIIGVTGKTGSGKSTLCRLLQEYGAAVIDADAIVRELQQKDRPGVQAIRAAFGDAVFDAQGELRRDVLAALVFSQEEMLQRLNGCMLPLIEREIDRKIITEDAEIIVVDAPILAQVALASRCTLIVEVVADTAVRKARLIARDGLSEAQAAQRITGGDHAPVVGVPVQYIENNEEGALQQQARGLWQKIMEQPVAASPQ